MTYNLSAISEELRQEALMKTRKTTRRVTTVLTLVLSLALLGENAYAEDMRLQWGAGISVSQEHDDNIDLSNGTDREESDWITSVTPRLQVIMTTEETKATLDYGISFVAYADKEENNTVRHSLSLRGFEGIRVAEHVTVDLRESFQVSENPMEISDYVTSVRRTRDRYYRNTAAGRVNYLFGEGDSLYAGFHHILLENDDPDIQDSQSYGPEAGIEYWFNIQNGFSLDYSYTRGEFDDSDDFDQQVASAGYIYRFSPRTQARLSYSYDLFDYDGASEDYAVHTGRLGLTRTFTEHLSGSLSSGYYLWDRERSDSTSGFVGDASLDGTFRFERGALGLNTSSGYRQQFVEAENLGFSRYYKASARFGYQLRERLSTGLSAFYRRDDYRETTPERTDDTWGGGANLSWGLFRWLTASLGYDYRERNSDIDANDYVDTRILFNLDLDLHREFFYRSRPYEF